MQRGRTKGEIARRHGGLRHWLLALMTLSTWSISSHAAINGISQRPFPPCLGTRSPLVRARSISLLSGHGMYVPTSQTARCETCYRDGGVGCCCLRAVPPLSQSHVTTCDVSQAGGWHLISRFLTVRNPDSSGAGTITDRFESEPHMQCSHMSPRLFYPTANNLRFASVPRHRTEPNRTKAK